MSVKNKLMIVDDDALVRQSLEMLFRGEPYELLLCDCGRQGIERMAHFRPDVVLLDLRLGDMDGIEVLRHIKARGDEACRVIMLTAHGSIENTVQAMREGAFDYLQKPFDNRRLKGMVKKALPFNQAEDEALIDQRLREAQERGAPKIIGTSTEMKRLYGIIGRVARSQSAIVLIEGESGTGKELAAAYVHHLSPRFDRPFVSLNCACIPEVLAESELFGYEKGAFTGGLKEGKPGKFQMAEGGTLFLDEIGDLSLGVQTKLLRVLEGKSYYRIGGTREIQCDVRVVTATNKSLIEEVARGRFREDLYYRLSALRVVIPPLRNRREDILPLASFFLQQSCRGNGRSAIHIAPEAGALLEQLPWKGNVRELRNAMERIVLLENCRQIRTEHIEFLRGPDNGPQPAEIPERLNTPSSKLTYDETMEKLLRAALAEAKGNQMKAARLLGISRAKLRYQIAKYDVKV